MSTSISTVVLLPVLFFNLHDCRVGQRTNARLCRKPRLWPPGALL
jgi:hypothetical protein